MKLFKEILSLISEAKFEKGGQDVGKMFGPSGKYAPKKGPKGPSGKAPIRPRTPSLV